VNGLVHGLNGDWRLLGAVKTTKHIRNTSRHGLDQQFPLGGDAEIELIPRVKQQLIADALGDGDLTFTGDGGGGHENFLTF
jgi:hypothetical protein